MKNTQRKKAISGTPKSRWFFILPLLWIAASFFPDERLWGINVLAFLPTWVSVVVAILGLLFCTPVLYRGYQLVGEVLFADRKGAMKFFVPLCFALCASALFWMFRMHTYFLGDGATYVAEIFRYVRAQPYSHEMLFSTLSAPLTGWMYATASMAIKHSSVVHPALQVDTRTAFWFFGTLVGSVFVLFSHYAVRTLFTNAEERFGAFLLLLSLPGSLFYFGYIEYYVFVYTVLGMVFLLMLFPKQRAWLLYIEFALIALASAFHLMALAALPAFLVLVAIHIKSDLAKKFLHQKNFLIGIGFILLIGAAYYFASGVYATGSRNIISLFESGPGESRQQYTLLSSYHLLDVVNMMLLVAAPLLILIPMLWRKQHLSHPTVFVAAINFFFLFCITLFGYASFGLARDWDINAILGIATAVFCLSLLLLHENHSARKYFLYIASTVSFCIGVSWIAVHVTDASSVERFKAVIALDAKHIPGDGALNGYEHLRKWFYHSKNGEGVVWAIEKKIDCVGYPSDFRSLALAIREALPAAQQRTEYDYFFDALWRQILWQKNRGVASSHAGKRAEFEELFIENLLNAYHSPTADGLGKQYVENRLRQVEAILPGNPLIDIMKAQMEWDRDQTHVPKEKFLRGAEAIRYSSALSVYAGKALISAGEYAAAKRVLERGYRADTTSTLPLFYLGTAEYALNESTEIVLTHLEKFLADSRLRALSASGVIDSKLFPFAEQLVQELKTERQRRQ